MTRRDRRIQATRERLNPGAEKKSRWESYCDQQAISAIIVSFMLVIDLITGKVTLSYATGFSDFSRSEDPFVYWFCITLYLVLSIYLWYSLFRGRSKDY